MITFKKAAIRSFKRATGLVLGISIAAGLFFIPGSKVHAETEALSANAGEINSEENEIAVELSESKAVIVTEADSKTETGVPVEAKDVDEVYTSEPETLGNELYKESIKKALEAKIGEAAGRLYSGITFTTLNDFGKRAAGFANAYSEGFAEFKKKQAEKEAAKIRAAKQALEGVPSEVLTYEYNPDMDLSITDKEYEILCKIVEAEAGDQDVYGRILVVNVILNRMNYEKEFPNDIEGVVFEKGQFSPISNGAYYRVEVDDITREAVERATKGEDYSQGAMYFIQRSSASKSGAAWFDTLTFILKYGCHEFYKD